MVEYTQQINQKIGDKIKSLRKSLGITQIELANSIGISYQQIQKYENGRTKITIERLKQIADIFRIPLDTFIENNTIFDRILKLKEDNITDVSLSDVELKSDEKFLLKLYRSIKDEKIKKGLLWQIKGIQSHQDEKF